MDRFVKSEQVQQDLLNQNLTSLHLKAEAVELVERELETAKDHLRKNVEVVEGINKSISVLESRHVETVERMKEVRIFWINDLPMKGEIERKVRYVVPR